MIKPPFNSFQTFQSFKSFKPCDGTGSKPFVATGTKLPNPCQAFRDDQVISRFNSSNCSTGFKVFRWYLQSPSPYSAAALS
jgi:hypothetical protein